MLRSKGTMVGPLIQIIMARAVECPTVCRAGGEES